MNQLPLVYRKLFKLLNARKGDVIPRKDFQKNGAQRFRLNKQDMSTIIAELRARGFVKKNSRDYLEINV